jgi:hypothetical protein
VEVAVVDVEVKKRHKGGFDGLNERTKAKYMNLACIDKQEIKKSIQSVITFPFT